MSKEHEAYKVVPWPKIRNLVDLLLAFHRPTTVQGYSEMDVTKVSEKIEQLKAEHGINLTLYTYLVYVVAQVAKQFPKIRTYRHGKKKLIVFNDVNIGMAVLKNLPDGSTIPGSFILKQADKLSLAQINQAVKREVESPLSVNKNAKFRRNVILKLPRFVQMMIYRRVMTNPVKLNGFFGNIGLTSLRYKDSTHPFVGFAPNIYTSQLVVGNVCEKFLPDEKKNLSLRKVLIFSAGVDHLIVDGMDVAQMSKFMADFIANAEGIDEKFIEESKSIAGIK